MEGMSVVVRLNGQGATAPKISMNVNWLVCATTVAPASTKMVPLAVSVKLHPLAAVASSKQALVNRRRALPTRIVYLVSRMKTVMRAPRNQMK